MSRPIVGVTANLCPVDKEGKISIRPFLVNLLRVSELLVDCL